MYQQSFNRLQMRTGRAPAAIATGLRGFWKGNLLNCIRTAPFKAVNYFTFDRMNAVLNDVSGGAHTGHERFLAGACAGVTATLTCFPLDVIRTRMMAPGHATGLLPTIGGMVTHEGLGAFYTGCLPAMVSMALGGAVFYGTYDLLKAHDQRRHGHDPYAHDSGSHQMRLSPGATLLYGAAAGLTAEFVTYPFEVLRRKMQLERLLAARSALAADGARVAGGLRLARSSFPARIMLALQLCIKERGLQGLYAGMLPNALQVLPSSALAYFVYEVMKVVLDVRE